LRVEINRSSWKAFLAGMLAIPLILIAIDLAFTHGFFRAPEANEDGSLTNQGLSEQRADLVWFAGLTIGGGMLIWWSLREITGSRRVVVADHDGLYLAIGSARQSEVFVPWSRIESIRSTFVEDETGPTPYLEVTISGPSWVPTEPRGARWEGDRLLVDATDWQTPVHEAAGLLQTMLERTWYEEEARRTEEERTAVEMGLVEPVPPPGADDGSDGSGTAGPGRWRWPVTDHMIGAHVASARPLEAAAAAGADLVQFFMGNPQSWKRPPPRDDAAELAAAGIPIYIHANYLINVGSDNNRIRIPSRKNLAEQVDAAAAIGAAGVIVHGGHVGDGEDLATGFERWRKALEPIELPVKVLIENTAGGGEAIVREVDNYGPLWEAIGDLNVGVCIDTCHAWAAGEVLETLVDRVVAATGTVDLVHCNDSRDPHDSRRDRHANLGVGLIPEGLLMGVVRAAAAPVVVETPGDGADHAADIGWIRDRW
jgi:deoxyribonuclease-4